MDLVHCTQEGGIGTKRVLTAKTSVITIYISSHRLHSTVFLSCGDPADRAVQFCSGGGMEVRAGPAALNHCRYETVGSVSGSVVSSAAAQYKFVVDGEWKYAPDQPAMYDEGGNVNNVLEVQEYVPENLDSLSGFDPPPSPPSRCRPR